MQVTPTIFYCSRSTGEASLQTTWCAPAAAAGPASTSAPAVVAGALTADAAPPPPTAHATSCCGTTAPAVAGSAIVSVPVKGRRPEPPPGRSADRYRHAHTGHRCLRAPAQRYRSCRAMALLTVSSARCRRISPPRSARRSSSKRSGSLRNVSAPKDVTPSR